MEAMTGDETSSTLMTRDEASSAVLSFVFGGALGNSEGKGVTYSHLSTEAAATSWIAGLQDYSQPDQPTDRYLIKLDRISREVVSSSPITIPLEEIEECVLAATGHRVKTIARSADGTLSISYRVSIMDDDATEYLIQLRFFADVTSMNLLMRFIAANTSSAILPIPQVYMIPGELERQTRTRFGRQITSFVHGNMAGNVYNEMTHEARLAFVRELARIYGAIWDLPMPLDQRLIGELRATSSDTMNGQTIALHVGRDRQYDFATPFTSVRDYLRAFIRFHLEKFEKQDDVDSYKDRYLSRVKASVEAGMHNIPEIVEQIPVVAQHCDLGPHNVIIKPTDVPTHSEIAAVIDWEFVASTPFMSASRSIDLLFREFAQNDFGPEFPRADELRQAFWEAIPKWKAWYDHEATVVFLEWYRFALFLSPAEPDEVDEPELWNVFWAENVRVTELILAKYGES